MDKQSDEIRALWALIMGHFVGQTARCECCDMLGQSAEDDARREEVLNIFRKMGFGDVIDRVTKEFFAKVKICRRAGNWHGWPYKTLPLVAPELLEAILKAAPNVLEENKRDSK